MSDEAGVAALLAGVGAFEETARAATPGPWVAVDGGVDGDWPVEGGPPDHDYLCASPDDGVRGGHSRADAAHIAAVDPVFVLGLCAAIRQVVERVIQVPLDDFHPGEVHPQVQWLAHHTLTTLARAFAGSGT